MKRFITVAMLILSLVLGGSLEPAYAQNKLQRKKTTTTKTTTPKPRKSNTAKRSNATVLKNAMSGQGRSTGGNPSRTVLYTLPQGEEFYMCEYYSNMKVSGNKFACMTYNPLAKKYSLIVNGSKIAGGEWVDAWWLDVENPSKCVYTVINNKEYTLTVDGQMFGPFEGLDYWKHGAKYFYDGTPNYALEHDRFRFIFTRMGRRFMHDADGTTYMIPENTLPRTFTSHNGRHKAVFSEDHKSVTLDDRTFSLPIDTDRKVNSVSAYVTDAGVCVCEISDDKWDWKTYAIADGRLYGYNASTDYFDLSTNRLRPISSSGRSGEPRQMEGNNLRWNDQTSKLDNGFIITLNDSSGRHMFMSDWKYDYVMIDDKRFGDCAPINAFYDTLANAFGWVTIEGRQLVLNTYRL